MTIGTVQLGRNYGIANDYGMPEEEKSFAMLSAAFENGVKNKRGEFHPAVYYLKFL